MSKGPIFVAGLERSGTSLMFALLASHPHIAMTRRTNMWTYFYEQYGDLSNPQNFERCLSMMMRYKRLVKLDPDPDRIRHDFWAGEPTYGRLFAILESHYAQKLNKPRWGDKSLHTERYAAPIFAAYPGARILHMMRDPRDRYASVLARWKTRRGRAGAGTAMWLASEALARHNRQRYPQQYMIVRYETLAAQPETTLKEICAFIGEPYSDEMLTMRGARKFRDEGSNSSYGERKPGVISTSSIGRYRQVLSPMQIAFIQRRAAQAMQRYDYAADPVQLTGRDRLLFALVELPLNQLLFNAWRVRDALQNITGRRLPDYRIVPEVGAT